MHPSHGDSCVALGHGVKGSESARQRRLWRSVAHLRGSYPFQRQASPPTPNTPPRHLQPQYTLRRFLRITKIIKNKNKKNSNIITIHRLVTTSPTTPMQPSLYPLLLIQALVYHSKPTANCTRVLAGLELATINRDCQSHNLNLKIWVQSIQLEGPETGKQFNVAEPN